MNENDFDENEFEYEGKRYVTEKGNSCAGCAFFINDKPVCPDDFPPCAEFTRKDKRSVIFKEVK